MTPPKLWNRVDAGCIDGMREFRTAESERACLSKHTGTDDNNQEFFGYLRNRFLRLSDNP